MSDEQSHLEWTFEVAEKLFARWRRRYGNQAITRYATGDKDRVGLDTGIADAMGEWAREFRTIPAHIIKVAVDRCEAASPKWPPTLPEFMLEVAALMPAKVVPRGAEARIECNPAARKAEFEAIRAILKAAAVPKRGRGRPRKANPAEGSLLAGSPEVR